jgi:triphosphatase
MDSAVKTGPALGEAPLTLSTPETEADPPAVAEPEAAPRDPWAKVRSLALKQLDRFMSLEPKVLRGDDPDAIHDMRVASRRLQQVLDLLHPVPSGEVRKLRRKIQRSRRALGDVRNADVQLERVHRILARKRAARRAAWEALHEYLVAERAEDFSRAIGKLGRINLADFYIRMKLVLSSGSMLTASAEETLGDGSFEPRITAALVQVWQAFDSKVEESHRDGRPQVIHGVRIAAKRLRYLVEVLHEFDVAGSSETLKWLRGVQELLGDWHDLEVLEQMMVEMIARPVFLRDNLALAMEVQKLILKCRAEKGQFREQYFRQTLEGADIQRVRDWAGQSDLKI